MSLWNPNGLDNYADVYGREKLSAELDQYSEFIGVDWEDVLFTKYQNYSMERFHKEVVLPTLSRVTPQRLAYA